MPSIPAAFAARLDAPLITRFAPSPTGYLHLGHVVNAIYVWGIAGTLGGTVLLRAEDHDRTRSRPEFEQAIVEDLAWLGFLAPDAPPPISRQRDRDAEYAAAVARLRAAGLVYGCRCSRRDIGTERYDGRCRDAAVAEGPGVGLRVRLGEGVERFDDLLAGPCIQEPAAQCGDLLVRDRDGHWTYHFAVTVDDLRQRVTLVVRGADLMSSTGRQLALRRLLMGVGALPDAATPLYLHHPLVLDSEGRKLSKSTGAAGVRVMRHRGLSPSEVIGQAAAAGGLLPAPVPLAAHAVPELFGGRNGKPVSTDVIM
jgi:glutamyl-tRNA synthetase/glutamyl-Q tRNA(Asp) synthetase